MRLIGTSNDMIMMTLVKLPEWFDVRDWEQPTLVTDNPYLLAHGHGKPDGTTAWEFMEKHSPERLATFHRALGMLSPLTPVTGYYDFGQLATSDNSRVVFVDVGEYL